MGDETRIDIAIILSEFEIKYKLGLNLNEMVVTHIGIKKIKKQNILIIVLVVIILIKIGIYNQDRIYDGYLHYKYHFHTSNMKEIDISDIDEVLNDKQDYFIYIGSEECPSCVSLIDNVKSVLNETDVKDIYYLPIDMSKDFMDDRFNEIFEQHSLETIPALIIKDEAEEISYTTTDIRNFK